MDTTSLRVLAIQLRETGSFFYVNSPFCAVLADRNEFLCIYVGLKTVFCNCVFLKWPTEVLILVHLSADGQAKLSFV